MAIKNHSNRYLANNETTESRSLVELRKLRDRQVLKTDDDFRNWVIENRITDDELALLSNEKKKMYAKLGEEIPLFPFELAAIPTELTRVALFSARRRGPRKIRMWDVLASRSDITIEYFGIELDNGIDQELWLLLLTIAQGMQIGGRLWLSQYALLRELGRSTGGQAKRNLRRSLDRLASATLRIRFVRNDVTYRLTTGFLNWGIEEETGRMFVRLDPDGQVLFDNLSSFDFHTHLSLKGSVTRALHLYAISHSRNKRHSQSLVNLKKWFGFEGEHKKFKMAVREAMNQLEESGVLSDCGFKARHNVAEATWRLNSIK